jgi:hypothetical protein
MRASSSINPRTTGMPALRRARNPFPATSGFGSCIAATTRLTPAAMIALVQGPVRPVWAHGSRVTYRSAPRAAAPASWRAIASACGNPAARWNPAPTTSPLRTKTAPTTGFGEVLPTPFLARRRASRMNSGRGKRIWRAATASGGVREIPRLAF